MEPLLDGVQDLFAVDAKQAAHIQGMSNHVSIFWLQAAAAAFQILGPLLNWINSRRERRDRDRGPGRHRERRDRDRGAGRHRHEC